KEIFTPGNEFRVFDTAIGKIGMMICFDLDFPESARTLHLKDADIILTPTNNMKPYDFYQNIYLQSRAMENELPIALCNRLGQERDLVYFGQSAIYDAFAKPLIKLNDTATIQTVEVPLKQTTDPNLNYKQNRQPAAYGCLL